MSRHTVGSCDARFSRLIRRRDEGCVAAEVVFVRCSGARQTAHTISRRFRSHRWDARNARALCLEHATWFTEHPHMWRAYTRESATDDLPSYEDLRREVDERPGALPDLDEVWDDLDRLEETLEARERSTV